MKYHDDNRCNMKYRLCETYNLIFLLNLIEPRLRHNLNNEIYVNVNQRGCIEAIAAYEALVLES